MERKSVSVDKLKARAERLLARFGGVMPLELRDEASEECLRKRCDEILSELASRYPRELAADGAGAALLLGSDLLKAGCAALLSPFQRASLLWVSALEAAEFHYFQPSPFARITSEEPDVPREVEDYSLVQWVKEGVVGLLGLLAPRQRKVVKLRCWKDMTFEQIGEKMGITPAGAFAAWKAAKKKLQLACPE